MNKELVQKIFDTCAIGATSKDLVALTLTHQDFTPPEAAKLLSRSETSVQTLLSKYERMGLLVGYRRVCKESGVRRLAYKLSGVIPEKLVASRKAKVESLARARLFKKPQSSAAKADVDGLVSAMEGMAATMKRMVDLQEKMLNCWVNQENK